MPLWVVTFKLDEKEYEKLMRVAVENNMYVSDVIRKAIEKCLPLMSRNK